MKQLTFASEEHEQFYTEQLAKCNNDCYHRALIYTLGITEDIRNHINRVFDFATDRINPNAIRQGWVTGTDARVLKLAFNLYNSGNKCDVSDAFRFYDDFSEYLLQGIALGYGVIR
ncbi:MAG: DUF6075 family protein [Candidatus Coproplasma sp.]